MTKSILLLVALLSWISTLAGVRYTTAPLNLRLGPGTGYDVVTTIPQGTPVTIDEDCDCSWIGVEYCGKVGYVSSRYLSRYYATDHSTGYSSASRYHHSSSSSGSQYYTNIDGDRVHRPAYYSSAPAGATAICRDGTYSYSKHRKGTCSHHGGVARWL